MSFSQKKRNINEKNIKDLLLGNIKTSLYSKENKKFYSVNYNIVKSVLIPNSVGDFNKDGILDVWIKLYSDDLKNNEYSKQILLGTLDLTEGKFVLKIFAAFFDEEPKKIDLKVEKVHKNVITITKLFYDLEDVYVETNSYKWSNLKGIEMATKCDLDNMKNKNIFKGHSKTKEVKTGILSNYTTGQIIEINKNLKIYGILTGCDTFLLSFLCEKKIHKNEKIKEVDFVMNMLEILESKTNFSSILTRIEEQVYEKNENGEKYLSQKLFKSKNDLTEKTFFRMSFKKTSDKLKLQILYYDKNKIIVKRSK